MTKKKLPNSLRKHIRYFKVRVRREYGNAEEARKYIQEETRRILAEATRKK